MLSSKQKKMKDKGSKLPKGKQFVMRLAESEYDLDRAGELWANMAMIQEMQGNSEWLDLHKKSGEPWFPFIKDMVAEDKHQLIVFEDQDKIFGFSFLESNKKNAVIREIYLEPSHREPKMIDEMVGELQECIKGIGLKNVNLDPQRFLG